MPLYRLLGMVVSGLADLPPSIRCQMVMAGSKCRHEFVLLLLRCVNDIDRWGVLMPWTSIAFRLRRAAHPWNHPALSLRLGHETCGFDETYLIG